MTNTLLTILLTAVLAGGAAFAVTRLVYRQRLHKAFDRIEYVLRVRAQTSELLMQARRQVESLTQELDHSRRLRAMPRAAAPTPLSGRRSSIVVNDTAHDNAFADTMMSRDHLPTIFSDTMPASDENMRRH